MLKNTIMLCGALLIALSALMSGGAIAQPQGGMGGPPDLSEAAETLGVTEEALLEALGGPPPDFAAAAEKLGISEEEIMEVMPAPPEGGGRPQ